VIRVVAFSTHALAWLDRQHTPISPPELLRSPAINKQRIFFTIWDFRHTASGAGERACPACTGK